MKKLLHERLIPDEYGVCEVECDEHGVTLSKYEARALRNEIKRYYIPRDKFIGEIDSLICDLDNSYRKADKSIPCNRKGLKIIHDRLKTILDDVRPSHKVLDADGVEIKVGDAVYDMKGLYNTPLEVLEIREKSIKVSIPDGKGYTAFTPENLTHKEPVLDADGVPIKVGDTVYRTDHPIQPSIVLDIECYYPEGHIEIKCSENDGQVTAFYSPSLLTHKEPDSLKKLRNDMRSFGEVGADCTSDCCLQYADRLSALIEKVN